MSPTASHPPRAEPRQPASPIDGPSLLAVGTALIEAAGRHQELGLALQREPAPGDAAPAPDAWLVTTRLATRPGAAVPDVRFGAGAPLAALARDVRAGVMARWIGDLRARFEAGTLHSVRVPAVTTPALLRARLAMELAGSLASGKPAKAAEPAVRLTFAQADHDAPTVRSRRARH